MGKDKNFAEYYTTVGDKLNQLPEVLNQAKQDYRNNTNIKPVKVIPSLKNNFRLFKVGGIIKAQSGVLLPNLITDTKMARLPTFDEAGVIGKPKNLNYIGQPIKTQVNIPAADAKRIDKVFPTIERFNQNFIAKGYTPEQSSGMLGNFFMESGLNPAVNQHGGGPGFGIGQ